MNESTKTISFVVVALLVVLGVWISRPSFSDEKAADMRGKPLFEKFTKADAATSLEMVRYDDKNGDVVPFKVAQVGGVWSIASHENYPADAKEHLAEAATSLMHLKVLGTAGDEPGEHAEFGVVDPTDRDLKPGAKGVGMRVTLKDNNNKTLADLIVGKEDPDNPSLRYVRRVGQAPVYTVELDAGKLTTNFDSWIEKDLLKLNPFDISDIFIQDYSIDEARGAQIQRGQLKLDYDNAGDPKWKLASDEQLDKSGKWESIPLGSNEQLDTEKLDAMATALSDLKIVDVARKPAGLSADLAADKKFVDNAEAVGSLMERGFYPAQVAGKIGIYSNEGETRVTMTDGVEYILRFGGIAQIRGGSDHSAEGEAADKSGVNRYLFVSATFNQAGIPKPELEPMPHAKVVEKEEITTKDTKAAGEANEPEKNEPKAEIPADGEKEVKEPKDEKDDALEKERQRIEKENQRKQEEYDGKIAEGKKRVAELNARFADWYYVISESVYEKIHLGRDSLIVPKKKPEGQDKGGANEPPNPMGELAPDAFQRYQEGIKP